MEASLRIAIWALCAGLSGAVSFNSPTTTSVNVNDDGIVNLWSLSVTCSPRRLESDGNYTTLSVDCTSSCTESSTAPNLFEISGNTLRKKACSVTNCGTCPSCPACSSANGCLTTGDSYSITVSCGTSGYDDNDSDTSTMTLSVTNESPTLSITLASPVSADNSMSVGDVVTTATATSGLSIIEWEENMSVGNSYLLGTSTLFELDTSTADIKVDKDPSAEYSYTYSMRVCVYSRRQFSCATTTINFSGCFQTPECNDQTDSFVNDTHAIGDTLFTMGVPAPSAHFTSISSTWQGLAFTQVSSTLGVTTVDPTRGQINTTGNITVHPNHPSVTHTTVVRINNSASCSYTSTCTMTYTVYFTNWPIEIINSVVSETIHEDLDARTTLFNVVSLDGNDPSQDNVTCTLATANTDLFEIVHDGTHAYDAYSIVKKVCSNPNCGFLCALNQGCLNWNLTDSYTMDVTCSDAYGSQDTQTFTVNIDRNEKFVWRNLPKTITVNSKSVAPYDNLFTILYTDPEKEDLLFNFSVTPAQPTPALFDFDTTGNYYNNTANVTSLLYQWDITNTTYVVFICGQDRRNYKCEDLTINIRDYCGPTPNCSTDSVDVTDQFAVGGTLLTITVPSSGSFSDLSYAIATEHTTLFDVDPSTGQITSLAALSVTEPPTNTLYHITALVYDTAACEHSSCDLTVSVSFTNFPISIDNMAPGAVSTSLHEDTKLAVPLLTMLTSDDNPGDSVNCTVDEANSDPPNNGIFYTEETDTHSGVFMIVSKEGPGFDFDVAPNYTIFVECHDRYGSSDNATMTVTIQENQPPTMTNLDNDTIINVDPLTTFSGATLFTLETSDAENDELTYSCSVNNTLVPLECLTDGVVSLRRNVIIPDENGTIYNITLCIYESVHNHALCAVLNVNFTTSKTHPVIDNLPATAYVAEDTSVDTIVFTFTVQDPDAGDTHTFSMSISPTEASSRFSLAASTGVVTLISALDYETYDSYNFTVGVSDQYLQALEDRTLFLFLNNTNEAPVLVISGTDFSTTEGSAGREIGVLNFECTDPDFESPTFAIASGTYMNYFGLNGVSGSFTHALDWDFENGGSLPESTDIVVTCSDDEGLSSSATLTVAIARVNEFPPVLNTAAENITIYSNQSLIESLLDVSATDSDYGHDGNFSFSIVGIGNGAEYFTMTSDGELRLNKYITWAYNFTFDFTIAVSDSESEPLMSYIDITVTYLAPDSTTEPTRPSYCLLCRTEGIVVVAVLGTECLLIICCITHICKRMKLYSIFQDKSRQSTGVPRRKTKISDLRRELEAESGDEEPELAELSENDGVEPDTAYRPGSECLNRALPNKRPPSAFYYARSKSPPPPSVYVDPCVDLSTVPEPAASPSQIVTTEAAVNSDVPTRGIRTIAELVPAYTSGVGPTSRYIPQLYQDDIDSPPTVLPGAAPMFAGSNKQPTLPHQPSHKRRRANKMTSLYPDTEVMPRPASARPSAAMNPSSVWEPPGHGGNLDF